MYNWKLKLDYAQTALSLQRRWRLQKTTETYHLKGHSGAELHIFWFALKVYTL